MPIVARDPSSSRQDYPDASACTKHIEAARRHRPWTLNTHSPKEPQ
ncbi:hypothetical protein [Pseudomonas panipatensis]|uniref:Uncharacterized protein n=1 Tax=Pseudomonas panipatensis TaxID=428992 RepID=A0A1G8CGZ6_9PSED|nr:hypothetical protein [Pseudomonas panipatensis]SDH44672.1 hypothetical protein SAMN05216272_101578 [Pseudomonas panipatensis]SMP64724.1 hypothetical protein SAMN06295951_106264 [Pseudomonas panipatensis]